MESKSCVLIKKKVDFVNFSSLKLDSIFDFNNKSVKSYSWAKDIYLPISLFSNPYLSAFETIVRYLKETTGLSYREISKLLNRNERTIWGTYNSSKKKMNSSLNTENNDDSLFIPDVMFTERSLSVLENLIEYLKDNFNLRYCKIASLLNRNDRTIWTVYKRAKRKRESVKNEM